MKKFLVMALVCLGIFSVSLSVNAAEKIDSGLNFQQMTAGIAGWENWDGTKTTDGVVINCNEWISLREYPSTSAPRLAKIPLNTWITIYNKLYRTENGTFIKASYEGMIGYCLFDYIRIMNAR